MISLNISGDFAYNETLVNTTYLISQTLGTLLNSFTFFIIWKYSSPEMKDYKLHLLLYQFGSASLDFIADTLATPVFFFPYIAGTSQGILHKTFGMETFLVAIIMFTYLSVVLHFIVLNPIFYRWQVILPDTSWMKINNRKVRFFFQFGWLGVVGITLFFLYYTSWEDSEINKASFREAYPQDAYLADVEGFYWVNTNKHPSFICALGWQSLWLVYVVFMIILCNTSIIRTLESLKHHMSPATRAMHMKFLKTIGLQTLVPMLWLEIPLFYWIFVIGSRIKYPGHQNINNMSVAFGSCHGAVGSVVLLFSNDCYRRGLYNIFIQPFRKNIPVTTLNIPSSQIIVTSV